MAKQDAEEESTFPEGYLDQMAFDAVWRSRMPDIVEAGHAPSFFATDVMRSFFRMHLHKWQSGELTEAQYVSILKEHLG